MYINPQDKALLITFSGASILVLIFFFLTVSPYDESQEEAFISIPVIEEIPEEEQENKEVLEEQNTTSQLTHQATNSDRLRREANRYFEEEDEIRETLKSSADQTPEEEILENNEPTIDYKKKLAQLRERERQVISQGEDTEAQETPRINTTTSRRSTVSYVLKNRNAVRIPNPVYTCSATGKVVINIEVNNAGIVTKTSFNKRASTTSDGCLVDQALQYANRALFNDASKKNQLGSITFEFQG